MDTKAKRSHLRDLDGWSDEKIAQFFEEHDPLEFLEETEPVEVDTSKSASTMIQVNSAYPRTP